MSVESILSITASLIAIGGLVYAGYQRCKKKSLSTLMTELVAKNTSVKGQQAILQKISRNLYLSGKDCQSAISGISPSVADRKRLYFKIYV